MTHAPLSYVLQTPNTALLAAMREGNWPALLAALQAGASAGLRDHKGRTVLYHVLHHHFANAANPTVAGPAIRHNAAEQLGELLALGVPPDLPGHEGPALLQAIYTHQSAAVALLLGFGANPNGAHRLSEGPYRLPLHLAAQHGQRAMCTLLLRAGAVLDDAEADGQWGRTALMCAAHAKQADVVADLLARGAAVSARDIRGKTVLDYAVSGGRRSLLVRPAPGGAAAWDPFHSHDTPPDDDARAAQVVRLLCHAGAHVSEEEWGTCPLHWVQTRSILEAHRLRAVVPSSDPTPQRSRL